MLLGLYIIVDDDTNDPVYADPPRSELDDALSERINGLVQDIADGEIEAKGTQKVGEALLSWRSLTKTGITFVAAVTDDIRAQYVELYLQKVAKRYMDEVDDPRSPDRGGVSEVVVDVIPPWEEADD